MYDPTSNYSNCLVNPNFILRSNFDSGQLHVFVIILFVCSFHSSREYFPHMHGDVDIAEERLQRARTTNGKIGPVYLSKNEDG